MNQIEYGGVFYHCLAGLYFRRLFQQFYYMAGFSLQTPQKLLNNNIFVVIKMDICEEKKRKSAGFPRLRFKFDSCITYKQ